jgi:hypothetical protein
MAAAKVLSSFVGILFTPFYPIVLFTVEIMKGFRRFMYKYSDLESSCSGHAAIDI